MPHTRRTAGTTLFALLVAALLLPSGATAAVWTPGKANVRAAIALGKSGHHKARARRAQQGCANADVAPTAANLDVVREAVLCLHNEIRAERDLPLLRENARLRRAAEGHSADMVERGYFEHTSPGGTTMVERIFRARYANRGQAWSFGENIAWGTGRLGTARGVMRAWMDSPGHRANILRGSYRELGVGIVTGVPTGASRGATYTADFGVRR
jgi:uncharacterized protein YkwD